MEHDNDQGEETPELVHARLKQLEVRVKIHNGSLAGLNARLSDLEEQLSERLLEDVKALRTEIKALWRAVKS